MCAVSHGYSNVCVVLSQANQAGPSTPEDYVEELRKVDFSEQVSEQDYQVIEKLRVSLSTNGLR